MASAPTGGTCGGGDGCASAIDLSRLGSSTLPIDTCAVADHVNAPCGAVGTRDVVLTGAVPAPPGARYVFTVDAGWAVMFLERDCVARGGGFCDVALAGGVEGNLSGGAERWYFAVERADGGCGRVNLGIDRVF